MTDSAIVVYSDDIEHNPSAVETALQSLGVTYTFFADLDAFIVAVEGGEWDLVILAEDVWARFDARDYDAVLAHIEAGGAAIVHSWAIGANNAHKNHPLWEALGGTYAGWVTSPSALYWWDAGHPLFEDVPEFTDLADLGYAAYGARMTVVGGPDTALGGFTTSPSDGRAGVIVHEDDKTIYKGLGDSLNSGDVDGDSIPDAVEWWRNAIRYVLDPVVWDAPWFSASPLSGTLVTSGDQTVVFDFNAAVVDQPGEYCADLLVKNDTPYGKLRVPVTMTVTPPDLWGKVTGVVPGWAFATPTRRRWRGGMSLLRAAAG